MLTLPQVQQALPSALNRNIDQSFVDKINSIVSDPETAEYVRGNFLSYTKVLQDGKFKIEDYLHAVTYVSFKVMGYSNQDSWFRTFPDRHQALVARGAPLKDISAHVSAYNKNKLVNLILEQTLVPVWVLNQDLYQKAINTQAEIMSDEDASFMARTAAANSLLTHLAKPKEAAGPLVNINLPESSGLRDLEKAISDLASKQRELIASGVPTRDIAAQKLIVNAEVVE